MIKYIVWFEWLYRISREGYVYNKKWNIIKWMFHKSSGYTVLNLYKDWKKFRFWLHVLVAITFLWDRPPWFCINHIDWNKNNNFVENLEYVSYKQNTKHAYSNWLIWKKSSLFWVWNNRKNKVKWINIETWVWMIFESKTKLSKYVWVSWSSIFRWQNKRWNYNGFIYCVL